MIVSAHGSFPEIVRHGVSGFLCRTMEEAVEAVGRISALDQQAIRQWVLDNFTTSLMSENYIYHSIWTSENYIYITLFGLLSEGEDE